MSADRPTGDDQGLSEAERRSIEEAHYGEECRELGEGHPVFSAVERILAARADKDAAESFAAGFAFANEGPYCTRCGRHHDWQGETSPGAPCMGCGRYPAAETADKDAAAIAAVRALADEWAAGNGHTPQDDWYAADLRDALDVAPPTADHDTMRREAAVWISPRRMGGEPCIAGTRLTTAMIAAHRDHATDWWSVTPEQVEVACWWEDRADAVAQPDGSDQ